ncbi:MAG: hypothetical protein J6T20_05570 [Treponema sp.]|nr:hypothetical protein [Treponema sp.]
MKYESLSPNLLKGALENRLKEIQQQLLHTKKALDKAPPGRIRISQKHGHPEYYLVTERGSLRGKYIPKKHIQLAAQLAQKDYDSQLLDLLKTEIAALQNYLHDTRNGTAIPKLYTSLCPSRRALIQPVTLTDEHYAEQWQSIQFKGRAFDPDIPVHLTAREERVRSKSEVIIADALIRHGIPYRYEYPLKLSKGQQSHTIYPDFLCLNIHTRREYIWEHFGMMDDPGYAQKATAKLCLYEENGILPGRNLILTMETQTKPISTRAVEKIIEEFLTSSR